MALFPYVGVLRAKKLGVELVGRASLGEADIEAVLAKALNAGLSHEVHYLFFDGVGLGFVGASIGKVGHESAESIEVFGFKVCHNLVTPFNK